MNIFCYPGLLQRREVASLLGLSLNPKTSGATIDFGFKARVPRINGSTDATEIDMRIDDLLIEAKLTESTFQQRDIVMVQRYRDFDVVFDRDALPRSKPRVKSVHDHDLGDILVTVPGERYESYQMIRNILAAYASQSRLCVLIDESRIDLREHYHAVLRTVRDAEVRTRCTLLTWQELSAELPAPLQQFLLGKYGIIR